jgi:hypothetical protein
MADPTSLGDEESALSMPNTLTWFQITKGPSVRAPGLPKEKDSTAGNSPGRKSLFRRISAWSAGSDEGTKSIATSSKSPSREGSSLLVSVYYFLHFLHFWTSHIYVGKMFSDVWFFHTVAAL